MLDYSLPNLSQELVLFSFLLPSRVVPDQPDTNTLHRPFYKKSERFYEPVAAHQENNKSYHDKAFLGTDGPIPIVYTDEYSTSHQHWHKTLNSLGVNTNKSHFSGSNVGVWTNIVSVQPETCTRADSTSSYYLPNAHRKNLTVLTGALARELVTEQVEGKWTAKGVRFVCGDEEFTATVSKEVLVAGGSISSPQLLELSGIGDPELLKAAGIAVKVPNKNVGENLQDHISTFLRTVAFFKALLLSCSTSLARNIVNTHSFSTQ